MSFLSCSKRSFVVPGGDPSASELTSEPESLKVVPVILPACECENARQPLARADQTSSGMRGEHDRPAGVAQHKNLSSW